MGLYVEVRKKEDGLPITNATFGYYAFSNLGNGLYFYWAPANVTTWVSAPGRSPYFFNTDYYSKVWIWLVKKPPPHSKSHSNGWT